ncbi:hypothetical protein [Paenibacillus contaminans]|uniref:Uncharacterized protein n=1 Tax=Paenibacillus contaminans TaxID=450362 RepID=A0A329M0L2_9BACL|nr:hypothetical protein [Paenibacillus contaminans]RAV12193.1 hypothetical protein DQG23_35320 [Paenibacillus contaminans]
MSSESIDRIMSQFEKLTDEEQNSMTTGLSSHFDKPIQFSATGLAALHPDELGIIGNILNGLILTKEYVPDIRGVYGRLNVTELSRNIFFGRIEES